MHRPCGFLSSHLAQALFWELSQAAYKDMTRKFGAKIEVTQERKNRGTSLETLLVLSLTVWEEQSRRALIIPGSRPTDHTVVRTDSEHTLKQNATVSLPARASAQREPVGLTLGVKAEWRPQSHEESTPLPVPAGKEWSPVARGPKVQSLGLCGFSCHLL